MSEVPSRDSDEGTEKGWRRYEWITVAFFLVLIVLGLAGLLWLPGIGLSEDNELLFKEISVAAIVAGTVGSVSELFVRRAFIGDVTARIVIVLTGDTFRRVVDESLSKLLDNPSFRQLIVGSLTGVYEERERFHKAGLQKIHESLDYVLLRDRFNTARTIRILQTWTAFDNRIRREIRKAARRDGCEAVKVLLLDPYSDQVRYRASALGAQQGMGGGGPQVARENIMEDLDALCRLNKVKVRVYDAAPIIAMFEFDSTKLIGIYWTGRYTIEGPQLEIVSSETAYLTQEVDELFKDLWGEENDTRNLTPEEYENWKGKNDELEKHDEQPLTLERYRAALKSS